MQKGYFMFMVCAALVLIFNTSVFAFGGGEAMPTVASPETVVTEEMQDLTIPLRIAGSQEVRQIPLFSEKYAETPVAVVNGEPITLKEFAMELSSMHRGMEGNQAKGKQNFNDTLDRLIAVKLVKQEAINIGFDRTPTVQNQLENFALKAMIQQLLAKQIKNIEIDEAELEDLYQQMAIEAKLLTYRFFDQADAEALLEAVREEGDFKKLADEQVAAGKAEGGEAPEFVRLNDLVPSVAQAVYEMTTGEVSEVFKAEKGYMLFRLEDRRVFEDAEVRQAAAKSLLAQESRRVQIEYLKSLEDKYATFDEEAEEALDFGKIMEENPQAKGTEVFARLSEDQRPLATISNGEETVVITVAEIAKKLEGAMYHGMDRVIDPKEMDNQRAMAIWNKLVAITGKMEAQSQGIDTSDEFKEKVTDFEERLLFDTFMTKAVVPGIAIHEDDVIKYYDEHAEEFSSPLMLKMKSLVFNKKTSAHEALRKLQAGSDFKWVSANSTNLADPENKDILSLGDNLLSITALPEDLHEQVEKSRQGDLFLYEGPDNLYYTLLIESAFPPVPKPYEEVRQEIGRILYAEAINDALAEWVEKLKEAYETENYLVQDQL